MIELKNQRHPHLAERNDSVLVVIDIQEKLIKHIQNKEKLISNIKKLIKTALLFDIPIILTEQEKLGQTVKPLIEVLGKSYQPIRKLTFSCMGNEKFREIIKTLKRSTFILTGIENHVCIEQTAFDMLESGYKVHVVKDVVASRKERDSEIAIEKMKSAGVIITSTEMIMYELMRKAGTPEFKKFLEIVKSSEN